MNLKAGVKAEHRKQALPADALDHQPPSAIPPESRPRGSVFFTQTFSFAMRKKFSDKNFLFAQNHFPGENAWPMPPQRRFGAVVFPRI